MNSAAETPTYRLKHIILLLCVLIFIYHMISVVCLFQGPVEHQIVHLGLMFLIVFLDALEGSRKTSRKIFWVACLIIGLAAAAYMRIQYDHLEDVIGFPETWDMVVGVALLAVVIVGTWLAWGSIFPILTITLIAYFFWGHLLPPPLHHPRMPVDLGISYLDVGLSGVFGTLLAVMANFGVNLLVFGALLEVGGANRFFLEVGKAAGRRLAGGPAQTAVVGSSLVGMVSGAAVGNVIITGSFTIPMMKKVGFRAESAGAIEATASTGSQLMPPIMGVAAFLMAGFLNKDFSEIMKAALVPSVLFYLAVSFGVQLIAKKEGVTARTEPMDRRVLLERGPLFILPLGALVALLLLRYSAGLASFAVNILILVMIYMRRITRPRLNELLEGLAKGVIMAARIALAVASVGVLSQIFITTGLAQKLTAVVEMVSLGNLWLTLFFTMIMSLILGLGLPATAAYAMVAILIAPGLVQMGIEDIRAHFFAFYFAIISSVTPPVALASLAASSISGASFFRTSMEAFKLSLPNFIIPFLIIMNPVFLLRPETAFGTGLLSLSTALAAMILLSAALYDFLAGPLVPLERIGLVLAATGLFMFCFFLNPVCLALGFGFGLMSTMMHLRRVRRAGNIP